MITASGFRPNMQNRYSESSSACMDLANMRARASDSPSATRLCSVMVGGFGLSPKERNVEQASASPYPAKGTPKKDDARLRVVLAEDNPGDVFLVREALETHGLGAELTVQQDGEQMLRFIERVDSGQESCPDLVLLDLNLPKRSGETLLKRLRESPLCARIPVLIVTSSDSPRDRETSARLGASGYFRKPPDFDEFLRLGIIVKQLIDYKEV